MEAPSKVPRPLSLSSDDLLHEAERMSATKFVSRFPSSEKMNLAHLTDDDLKSEAPSLLRMEWNPMTGGSLQAFQSLSTSTLIGATNTYNNDDAPTIEDNEKHDSFQSVIVQEHVGLLIPEKDPHGPHEVQRKVDLVIYRWGPVEPMNPERFFLKLLSSRGYEISTISALNSHYCSIPCAEQIQGYDNELVTAVKISDLDKIKSLHRAGRSMSSCNKFSESIVHMACRRASFEVAEFVLSNGGNCNIVDDYGRTPLHDACWRMEPRFDIVTLLLDSNLELLRIVDIRGSTPLKYVREEHWVQWCAYFYHQKEKYWQPRLDEPRQLKRTRDL